MPQFKEVTQEDVEYFVRRSRAKTDTIHISKNFSFPSTDGKRRYVYKQIEASENLEVVKLKGELVLTSSPAGRKQVKVLVFEDDGGRISFTLQQFNGKDKPFSGQSVSFYSGEWQKLMTFLGDLNFIDFSDHRNHWYSSSAIREQVLVTKEDKKLVDSFRSLEGDDRISVLQQISEQNLSKDDLDILSGRRNGLAEFTHQLYTAKEWDEPKWQGFFRENHWISDTDSTIDLCPSSARRLPYQMLMLMERALSTGTCQPVLDT